MALESGLAFLEGVVLIASPCILPVLPLVLSASIDGGRARPFGIIAGFVLAFSAFALFSRLIVEALGIAPQTIKDASLVLLAVFGLVLLSSKLSDVFSRLTQGVVALGGGERHGGFFGGVGIGALIGFVWTPCAGPILAAVLVQVIRQESTLGGLGIVIPFALGAGLPMLAIALLGRKAVKRLGFLARHAEIVRKGFGVLMLAAVAFLASGVDINTVFMKKERPAVFTTALLGALPAPMPAPEFQDIKGWINGSPLTMASLRGKVVLVDFWTYSCINCLRTLPYLKNWDAMYKNKGLVIVGVHAPEFEFEKDETNVRRAVKKFGINYRVALDSDLDTWAAFQNRYWPAHYLIDRKGNIVYTHFGEGNYGETENNIRVLLGIAPDEKIESMAVDEQSPAASGQTPETYLGYARAENFANVDEVRRDAIADFTSAADDLKQDQWTLGGRWLVEGQRIISREKDAVLSLKFKAKKVYLVLGAPKGKTIDATIMLNDRPANGADVKGGTVHVDGQRLYTLVEQNSMTDGTLDITASAPGLEAYAFTFGN